MSFKNLVQWYNDVVLSDSDADVDNSCCLIYNQINTNT